MQDLPKRRWFRAWRRALERHQSHWEVNSPTDNEFILPHSHTQALAERTVILGMATSTQGAAPAAGAVIARYAGLLAAQVCSYAIRWESFQN